MQILVKDGEQISFHSLTNGSLQIYTHSLDASIQIDFGVDHAETLFLGTFRQCREIMAIVESTILMNGSINPLVVIDISKIRAL